jgi:hypothetical protein
MDGVLDERQKLCDTGIVFRALNFAQRGRENPSSLARALYCAPRAFESLSANTAPCQVRSPAAKKHSSGFTRVIMQGPWTRTAEAHIFWRPFRHMDAMDGLCWYGF